MPSVQCVGAGGEQGGERVKSVEEHNFPIRTPVHAGVNSLAQIQPLLPLGLACGEHRHFDRRGILPPPELADARTARGRTDAGGLFVVKHPRAAGYHWASDRIREAPENNPGLAGCSDLPPLNLTGHRCSRRRRPPARLAFRRCRSSGEIEPRGKTGDRVVLFARSRTGDGIATSPAMS